ncbi:hypothetical protein Sango_1577800 [Sesamum angolense]|uniref:DUF4283 domain-containing protein n=1 Tax=Sesamum angolense TaxID=2727404 RepID=A0AAE2BTR2_9LAMI|nr:hypothetical protein Sango_1577800 [Sesamum angolense]
MDFGDNRFKSALSLTEAEDDGVVIASNMWYRTRISMIYFLWDASYPTDLFTLMLLRLLWWRLSTRSWMDLKPLEENHFLLKFNHIVDRNRVLEGCPWSFEKNLLVLNTVDMNENPQQVNLDWAAFHIHVHGLPLSKMSKEMAQFIGNHVGRFVDVDMNRREMFRDLPCGFGTLLMSLNPQTGTENPYFSRMNNYSHSRTKGCLISVISVVAWVTYPSSVSYVLPRSSQTQVRILLLVLGCEQPISLLARIETLSASRTHNFLIFPPLFRNVHPVLIPYLLILSLQGGQPYLVHSPLLM